MIMIKPAVAAADDDKLLVITTINTMMIILGVSYKDYNDDNRTYL